MMQPTRYEHELDAVREQRDRFRKVLEQLVGVGNREELEAMEFVMRSLPAPAADKAATIDAIHALLETLE